MESFHPVFCRLIGFSFRSHLCLFHQSQHYRKNGWCSTTLSLSLAIYPFLPFPTIPGRTFGVRQLEEVHRLHSDLQHSRDLSFPPLHLRRHSSAAGNDHDSLHRFGYRHGAGDLIGVRESGSGHYEAPAP